VTPSNYGVNVFVIASTSMGVRGDELRVQHVLGGAVVMLEDGAERSAGDARSRRAVIGALRVAVGFGRFGFGRSDGSALGSGLFGRVMQRAAIELSAGDEHGEARAKPLTVTDEDAAQGWLIAHGRDRIAVDRDGVACRRRVINRAAQDCLPPVRAASPRRR
jgi:hypothetical protein